MFEIINQFIYFMQKFFFIIIFTLLFSCSTDDNDNNQLNENRLVKKEFVNTLENIEYWYDDNMLTRIVSVSLNEDRQYEDEYLYNSSNNVIERNFESNNSDFNSITAYSYDNSNRLISATNVNNSNVNGTTTTITTLSYNGNIITINEDNDNNSDEIVLETNASGLVTKMYKDNYYSLFSYDSNNNIISIETFDVDDELQFSHNYTYDQKINPFYGQLKSLYFLSFIETMSELSYGEDLIFPFNGYYFPFLKNNLISLESDGDGTLYQRDFVYSYDDNYPIYMTTEYLLYGFSPFQFNIEYY